MKNKGGIPRVYWSGKMKTRRSAPGAIMNILKGIDTIETKDINDKNTSSRSFCEV